MRQLLLPATQRVKRPSIVIDDIRPYLKNSGDIARSFWNPEYGYYRNDGAGASARIAVKQLPDQDKFRSVSIDFAYDNRNIETKAYNYVQMLLSDGRYIQMGISDGYTSPSRDVLIYPGEGQILTSTEALVKRTLKYQIPAGTTLQELLLVSYYDVQSPLRGMRNFIFEL